MNEYQKALNTLKSWELCVNEKDCEGNCSTCVYNWDSEYLMDAMHMAIEIIEDKIKE